MIVCDAPPRPLTHKGFMCGIPVYLSNPKDESPFVVGRNRVYHWFLFRFWLPIVELVFRPIALWAGWHEEPKWEITVTGEYHGK